MIDETWKAASKVEIPTSQKMVAIKKPGPNYAGSSASSEDDSPESPPDLYPRLLLSEVCQMDG